MIFPTQYSLEEQLFACLLLLIRNDKLLQACEVRHRNSEGHVANDANQLKMVTTYNIGHISYRCKKTRNN